jgi:hypothetical protein
MTRFLEKHRPAWLTHTGLDLRGISMARRHIYVYTGLLLCALLGGAIQDYKEIAKVKKLRAKAARAAQAPQ